MLDDAAISTTAFDGFFARDRVAAPSVATRVAAASRVGVICNPKSHGNRSGDLMARSLASSRVAVATPRTREALMTVLQGFADDRIDLLVIDGGDGTVRDVLSCAGRVWSGNWPRIAIVPSGKTNALALDLGIPVGWTVEQALAAEASKRFVVRHPIEVARRDDEETLRGFLFGTGAFVSATALAQRTHRVGAFHGVAVTLALAWALLQTLFGSAKSIWRSGQHMSLRARPSEGGDVAVDDKRYLLLASTLTRLPVGLKPFGRPRAGLKILEIDAPPRRLIRAVPFLLAGSEASWLDAWGYRRFDTKSIELHLDHDFILDGEIYPGGDLTVREAGPLRFVVP